MEITNVVVLGTAGYYEYQETPPEFMDIAVAGVFNFDEDDDTVSVPRAWPPF